MSDFEIRRLLRDYDQGYVSAEQVTAALVRSSTFVLELAEIVQPKQTITLTVPLTSHSPNSLFGAWDLDDDIDALVEKTLKEKVIFFTKQERGGIILDLAVLPAQYIYTHLPEIKAILGEVDLDSYLVGFLIARYPNEIEIELLFDVLGANLARQIYRQLRKLVGEIDILLEDMHTIKQETEIQDSVGLKAIVFRTNYLLLAEHYQNVVFMGRPLREIAAWAAQIIRHEINSLESLEDMTWLDRATLSSKKLSWRLGVAIRRDRDGLPIVAESTDPVPSLWRLPDGQVGGLRAEPVPEDFVCYVVQIKLPTRSAYRKYASILINRNQVISASDEDLIDQLRSIYFFKDPEVVFFPAWVTEGIHPL